MTDRPAPPAEPGAGDPAPRAIAGAGKAYDHCVLCGCGISVYDSYGIGAPGFRFHWVCARRAALLVTPCSLSAHLRSWWGRRGAL